MKIPTQKFKSKNLSQENKQKVFYISDKDGSSFRLSKKQMETIYSKFGDVRVIQLPYEQASIQFSRHQLEGTAGIVGSKEMVDRLRKDLQGQINVPLYLMKERPQELEQKHEHVSAQFDSYKESIQEYARNSMMDYIHHGLHRSDMDFDYLHEASKAGVISHAGMARNSLQETALEAADIECQMMLYIKEGQHILDFDYEKILEEADSPEILPNAFANILKQAYQFEDIPYAMEKLQDIYNKLELGRPAYEQEINIHIRETPAVGTLFERIQEEIERERVNYSE